MRKISKRLTAAVVVVFTLHTLAAIFLCELAVHFPRKPLNAKLRSLAESGALQFGANLEDVQVTSYDGVILSAWFFRPRQGNGSAVVMLHGHGDNREGMLGFAPIFLRRKYAVLIPDARAHGESGGNLESYGRDESRDLSRWVDWLSAQDQRGCIYGLGESLGAAILLQSLSRESRFCSAVAESPFASFREVAYDRMGQRLGAGAWMGRTLFGPLVSEAFLCARWRYGIDFDKETPAKSAASTQVPVLLIHGTQDFNIPLRHCEAILKNHSGVMEFWQVPGAGHTGAFGREPEEFERRVTGWFSRYSRN